MLAELRARTEAEKDLFKGIGGKKDGFGSSEEEFDAGSFGGGDGGGAEEDGPGLLGQIWDFFNDFNED